MGIFRVKHLLMPLRQHSSGDWRRIEDLKILSLTGYTQTLLISAFLTRLWPVANMMDIIETQVRKHRVSINVIA